MMKSDVITRFYMTYEHVFPGVRYIDKRLVPVQWKLGINMTGPEVSDNPEEQTKRSSIMYQKIVFFLESVFNDCIITGIGDSNEVGHFYNPKVLIPELDPTDDIILQTVHSKLSAIAGEDMVIMELSLYSSDTKVKYTYNHDGKYDLPLQKDFLGEDALHDVPWWSRNDCDAYDVFNDHVDREELLQSASILQEFEEHISGVLYGNSEDVLDDVEPKEPAKIIRVDQWQKPRKV